MKWQRSTYLLIPALALLLLLLAALLADPTASAQPNVAELVSGTYEGGVTVSEPAALGALDLRLDINSTNGVLSGQVNPIKTQVFLGGPTFTGQVTVTSGMTPTVRIESQLFSGTVSGRTVQRRFVLTGAVLAAGNGLRGDYTETILGFTAKPMLIKGKFLLTRPNGLARIVTVPAPAGSTPTSTPTQPGPGEPPTLTPTATTPGGNPGPLNQRLFLPLVHKNANMAKGAAVDEMVNIPVVAITATPTVTPTGTVVMGAAGREQTYLPLINR